METIRETLRQEQVLAEQEELSTGIKEAHSEIEFLRRRLDRLVKLQSLLKEKYHSRLDSLSTQLRDIDIQQWELRNLTRQLKRNKKKQSLIKEQIASLERRKKTLLEVIRQIAGYKKSSDVQVAAIEEEQEILSQRIHDVEHMLELVEQAELNKKEWEIVVQRIHATKRLLEEHETDLSKRTIDLLFEFYIPPRSNKRLKLII
jgi:predicted  nucleic acid-binding Zn-ribbon protein